MISLPSRAGEACPRSEYAGSDGDEVQSSCCRLLLPSVMQRRGVHAVGLCRPGCEYGGSFQGGDGARVGVGAVVFGAPPPDQLVELGVDVGAALREHLPHRFGDTDHVGVPVVDGFPGDTEAVGELGA